MAFVLKNSSCGIRHDGEDQKYLQGLGSFHSVGGNRVSQVEHEQWLEVLNEQRVVDSAGNGRNGLEHPKTHSPVLVGHRCLYEALYSADEVVSNCPDEWRYRLRDAASFPEDLITLWSS